MTNEYIIMDYLTRYIKNPYGVSAVMGNLMAESSMSPVCATGLAKTGISSVAEYVTLSDDGEHDFANDGVAFGLVQWCYKTRKKGFLDYAKSKQRSIADIHTQLEYLVKEMSESYKSVWSAVCNATSIRDASDMVMLKYEKPANTGESARKKRADYGQQYYDRYFGGDTKQVVRVTANNVNVRVGPGKDKTAICRVNKDTKFQYYGTDDNGWNGIVLWLHPDFSEVINERL